MKLIKLLLLMSLILISIEARCHKTVDATLVLMNGDTVYKKIVVKTNIFDNTIINLESILSGLNEINASGHMRIVRDNVVFLSFLDFKNEKRIFAKREGKFVELVYNGKIKWYRIYSTNTYDNSLQAIDEFVNEKLNIDITVSLFKSLKKKLKELTADKPELQSLIEELPMSDENIKQILSKYEDL